MAKDKATTPPPDEFADALDAARPEAFIFKSEGDKLIGTVEDFSMGFDPKYRNDSYPIVVVRDESDGSLRSVHCFHTTMMSSMEQANPQIGERIGIVYMGERKPKGDGNPYKDFRVKIDRKAGHKIPTFAELFSRDDVRESESRADSDAEDGLPF